MVTSGLASNSTPLAKVATWQSVHETVWAVACTSRRASQETTPCHGVESGPRCQKSIRVPKGNDGIESVGNTRKKHELRASLHTQRTVDHVASRTCASVCPGTVAVTRRNADQEGVTHDILERTVDESRDASRFHRIHTAGSCAVTAGLRPLASVTAKLLAFPGRAAPVRKRSSGQDPAVTGRNPDEASKGRMAFRRSPSAPLARTRRHQPGAVDYNISVNRRHSCNVFDTRLEQPRLRPSTPLSDRQDVENSRMSR